jgi:hypothetical protein
MYLKLRPQNSNVQAKTGGLAGLQISPKVERTVTIDSKHGPKTSAKVKAEPTLENCTVVEHPGPWYLAVVRRHFETLRSSGGSDRRQGERIPDMDNRTAIWKEQVNTLAT